MSPTQSVPSGVHMATADPRRPAPDDEDRKHKEELLDEALDESFPASDPPSMTEPDGDDGETER